MEGNSTTKEHDKKVSGTGFSLKGEKEQQVETQKRSEEISKKPSSFRQDLSRSPNNEDDSGSDDD